MRHRNSTPKLGRTTQHRELMLANLVCSLILRGRVRTTLQKAKVARSLADRMVTLGKKGGLHHRRLALATLRQESIVKKLFAEVAPRAAQRNGGYTRVMRIGQRIGDAGMAAYLEWTDDAVVAAPADQEASPKGKSKGSAAEKPAA